MGYRTKQRILNRRISNDQKTLKEMNNVHFIKTGMTLIPTWLLSNQFYRVMTFVQKSASSKMHNPLIWVDRFVNLSVQSRCRIFSSFPKMNHMLVHVIHILMYTSIQHLANTERT